jgi:hypothetical protein
MALESPVQRDGDRGFLGFASRLNPLTLPPGMLQDSLNMRLDRGTAQTRKGAKRLASDISVSGTPLTVPFILAPAPNEPIVRSIYSGGIFASVLMLLPEESIGTEAALLAGPDSVFTYITDSALDITSAGAAAVLAVSSTENLVTDTNDELLVIALPPEISLPTPPDEIIEPTDKVSMLQAYNRLYFFREADRNQPGWGTNFTSGEGIEVSGAVATVYVDAHGYEQGARVRIEGGAAAAFAGHEYDIATVIDTDRFTIAVPNPTASEPGANTQVRRVKPPLYWDGDPSNDFVRTPAGVPAEGPTYKRMRSVPWATYINNRLILPDGRQGVMISDVLDPDLYDPFWQSFRVGKGGNDFIVAIHPWVDGSVLIFCRKSIWLASLNQSYDGTNGESLVARLDVLTDEIGCSARRTIATAGNFVYFLSDSGVYRLDARLDLKLRGDTKPLSEPIADKLQVLNTDLIEDSVAVYQDNRYYLAVPLANSTDSNNGMFIYSQLNETWETEDTYGFGVNNFLVGNVAGERRIMITNRAGYLMLLNQREDGDDSPDAEVNLVAPVPGRIITRRYSMGSMTSKRFTRALSDVVLPDTGSITVRAILVNPDRTITLLPGQSNDSGVGEDYSLKQPIRQKAHYAELEFQTTAHRPEIRNVSIEAAGPSNPPTETRNAA